MIFVAPSGEQEAISGAGVGGAPWSTRSFPCDLHRGDEVGRAVGEWLADMCWISWSGPYNKKEEKEKNAGDGDGDGDGRLAGGDRERNQKAPTNQLWSLTASS